MKWVRMAVCMALLAGGVCGASAADRAGEILGRVADGFRAMKRYTVRFEVVADDYRTAGGYAVSDGNYRLFLGDDAEVFSDGKVRYEVDHRRGEVTIADVNRSSRNILENPVRAFDFLDSEYAFTLEWERDGKASVRLTPTGESNAAAGVITLVVDTASMRPQSACLRLRWRAGRDSRRRNRTPCRCLPGLRPQGLCRLRVHRLPVRDPSGAYPSERRCGFRA